MDLLGLREPVSAGTHGLWLLLAMPGTVLLWRRSERDRSKQISLLVYGLSLVFCYAASMLLHGLKLPGERLLVFSIMDHIGIYFLIAGTYTPIAWTLMRGQWRWGSLFLAWLAASAGSLLQVSYGSLPPSVYTWVYLGMGWGAVLCYAELARSVPPRALLPLLAGGLIYSVGAVINLIHWPEFWPGVFGSHELFHLFVMSASLLHYLFMLTVVVPYARPEPDLAWQPSWVRRGWSLTGIAADRQRARVTAPHARADRASQPPAPRSAGRTRRTLLPLLAWRRE
jgi:hemolysin III